MNRSRWNGTATLVAGALALSGCAAPPGRTAAQADRPGSGGGGGADVTQVCNPVAVGIGAAIVCGALASGNRRVKTGAACAAAAVTACYLANGYLARQTRTRQEVEDDYLRQHPELPERSVITAYRSTLAPSGAVVRRGQEVQLASTIVAVQGRFDRNVLVEEELGVVDSQGEVWGRSVRKTANAGNQAGEFQTVFTIPVTDGMSQGVYVLRRSLYLNGVAVRSNDTGTRFQVV